MPALDEPRFNARAATFALLAVFVCLLALVGRVAYLQSVMRDQILAKATRQQHRVEKLPARRGSIFDRNGFLLAGTEQVPAVFIDPQELNDSHDRTQGLAKLEEDLTRLAALLELDAGELIQSVGEQPNSRYLRIKDEIDPSTAAALLKLDLPGVGIEPQNVRHYPMNMLAAHIIGALGKDGKGLEGLELTLQKTLVGTDGKKRSLKDSRNRAIFTAADDYTPPQHGKAIMLTIDATIQMIAEEELARTCDLHHAESGEVVVMDPKTGEVLALANWPTFAPQAFSDAPAVLRKNRALVDPYEPGSTLKPFVVSGALAAGKANLSDVMPLAGKTWKTSYGRTITDIHGYNDLALWDVLVKSSNIGMSMLVARMSPSELRGSLTHFGFGSTTKIDLPGEAGGVLSPLKKWTKFTPESLAQGYEILVTPLQMCSAMATLANDGQTNTPHVLKGIVEDSQQIKPLPGEAILAGAPRAISPELSRQMLRVLADIPVRGTASKARSSKYNFFGKTGTAHRAFNGKYDEQHYTASFVGGAPFEDPRLVIALVVHNPDKTVSHFGGIVAAPAAGQVLERSLTYLQVPASPPLPMPPESIASKLYQWSPKVYEQKEIVTNAAD